MSDCIIAHKGGDYINNNFLNNVVCTELLGFLLKHTLLYTGVASETTCIFARNQTKICLCALSLNAPSLNARGLSVQFHWSIAWHKCM